MRRCYKSREPSKCGKSVSLEAHCNALMRLSGHEPTVRKQRNEPERVVRDPPRQCICYLARKAAEGGDARGQDAEKRSGGGEPSVQHVGYREYSIRRRGISAMSEQSDDLG